MAVITLGGKQFEVDEDGFMQDPSQWDDAMARALAETEGITELTEEHWKVIRFLRSYYHRCDAELEIIDAQEANNPPVFLVQLSDSFRLGQSPGHCVVPLTWVLHKPVFVHFKLFSTKRDNCHNCFNLFNCSIPLAAASHHLNRTLALAYSRARAS